MAYVKFDPFRGFEGLTRKMNDIFSELDKGVAVEYGKFAPRVDILEDDEKVQLNAELPGMRKDEVKITINDENILTIKGEKKRPVPAVKAEDTKEGDATAEKAEEITCIRAERSYGEFSRAFQLGENIDRDSVSAKFTDGVLVIELKKKEPEQPKEKEISIS